MNFNIRSFLAFPFRAASVIVQLTASIVFIPLLILTVTFNFLAAIIED